LPKKKDASGPKKLSLFERKQLNIKKYSSVLSFRGVQKNKVIFEK